MTCAITRWTGVARDAGVIGMVHMYYAIAMCMFMSQVQPRGLVVLAQVPRYVGTALAVSTHQTTTAHE